MVKRVKSVSDLDRLAVKGRYRVPMVEGPKEQVPPPPPPPVRVDMGDVRAMLQEMERRLLREMKTQTGSKTLLSAAPSLRMTVVERDGKGDIETVDVTLVTN